MTRRSLLAIASLLLCQLAAATPPLAETFGRLPAVYDAAISPDGKQIALFYYISNTYGIRIISLDNSDKELRVRLLTEGVKPAWIRWANDNQVLAALWRNDKIQATPVTVSYIYTLNTNTLDGKILVEPKNIIRQFNSRVIDWLDDDPDHILMAFSDRSQFISDIQKVNVVTGRYRKVKRGNSNVQTWFTDLRSEPRVGQGLADRNKESWTLIIRDADGKTWRDSDEYPNLEADVDIFGFTADPNELVIGHRADKDTLGLYVYHLKEKAITRQLFHHDDYDAKGLVLSGDGSDVVGARFVADTTETLLFGQADSALSKVRQKFPNYTVDYVDSSRDGEIFLFKISNAHSPGALAMVVSETGEVARLVDYHKDLPSEQLGRVVRVKYPARDGTIIPGYVTLPPSIASDEQLKNVPFVVLPHGGPYTRTSRRFYYFSQFFATRGFAVLQMNFRGSTGYGKEFEDSGRNRWEVMLEDVEDGAKWVVEKGYADPERMCIAGWSFGGYAALMSAVRNPERYACVVSVAGVTDLQNLVNDVRRYRFGKISARNSILNGFDGTKELKLFSPTRRAAEITAPLMLVHGSADQRVHFDHFKRMRKALRKHDSPVKYLSFKDEDHFLSKQQNRQEFFIELEKFLVESVGESEFMLQQ